MKNQKKLMLIKKYSSTLCLSVLLYGSAFSQDTIAQTATEKKKLVKNTFESSWLMDNQSVIVEAKGTFEMDIQHRFGTVNNGYDDFFGLYAPSNIRIGLSYVIIDKLQGGLGFTKERLQWDVNGKYALLKQETSGWPISITYFGNIVADTRGKENFVTGTDRISYFNQIIIARKITTRFSVQTAPSFSHYNNVEGYFDSNGDIQKKMKNQHLGISFMGRYKITDLSSIVANYDQALTTHPTNNPHPNLSLGFETTTSSHAFQVFFANSQAILPQNINYYNRNNYKDWEFLIGFNITRVWGF